MRAVSATFQRDASGRPFVRARGAVWWYCSPGIPRFTEGERVTLRFLGEDPDTCRGEVFGIYRGSFCRERKEDERA
jgi:hypothetical protein